MQRDIVEFFQDEEAHWVARLDCEHGQHVRHVPPFVNRPWTQTREGRDAHVGTTLDCLKCERLELPDAVTAYRATPEFSAASVPAGLLRDHSTKRGVWGRIRVLAGRVRYIVTSPFEFETELRPGTDGIIAPLVLHRVELSDTARFHVEFLARRTD